MFKQKRGQETMGMSFGMIFSIILIAAVVAVAIYAIVYFIGIGKCSDAGFFYDDLQKEINRAWNSDIYSDRFSGKLPKDIEAVCFGNFTVPVAGNDGGFSNSIKLQLSGSDESNFFIYPSAAACGGRLDTNVLKNVNVQEFFCVNRNSEEEFEVKLGKNSNEAVVKITRN